MVVCFGCSGYDVRLYTSGVATRPLDERNGTERSGVEWREDIGRGAGRSRVVKYKLESAIGIFGVSRH